jgi:hypothetical protein
MARPVFLGVPMSLNKLFVLVPLFLVGLVACTTKASAQEVVDRSAPIACAKTKECSGDALFAIAFPEGEAGCIAKTKEDAKKKYGDDLENGVSVCTEEEVDACLEKFKATACPADGSAPAVPCNC